VSLTACSWSPHDATKPWFFEKGLCQERRLAAKGMKAVEADFAAAVEQALRLAEQEEPRLGQLIPIGLQMVNAPAKAAPRAISGQFGGTSAEIQCVAEKRSAALPDL
jgi:hypothetical protein